MKNLLRNLKELKRYPSAIAGLIIIGLLLAQAAFALIAIPHSEAVRLWRAGPGVWEDTPRLARPVWTNVFTREKLPPTMVFDSAEMPETKSSEPLGEGHDITSTSPLIIPTTPFRRI